MAVLKKTLPIARRFWERVREEKRISNGFHEIAEQALRVLEKS